MRAFFCTLLFGGVCQDGAENFKKKRRGAHTEESRARAPFPPTTSPAMSTSRARVQDALNFRRPDRVPVDLGGHRTCGIAAIAYAKLKQALGIASGDTYVYDVGQQLAIVEPRVLDALGVDTVELGRAFLTQPSDWKAWTLPDGTPCRIPAYVDMRREGEDWYVYNPSGRKRAVQRKGCLYFESAAYPLADYELEDGIEPAMALLRGGELRGAAAPGNHFILDAKTAPAIAQTAREFYQNTDRAVVGLFAGSLLKATQDLFGMENTFVQMAAAPDEYEALIAAVCELYLENLEHWMTAFGDSVDVIQFADDFGSQTGPLFSPQMYRRFFKPCQKRLWDYMHAHSKAKLLLHSCGGIEPLLEDMIEIGLDAINPVQITCEGMEPAALKQKYGGRIAFWGGGCDTRDILPHGTPAQIREHVLRQCAILSPGGGFVFQQVHNIQADIPPENIIAMYEAVKEFNAGRPGS